MVDGAVGRGGELQIVARWLDAVPAGATALLIEGEAGIGKTTVLDAGATLAESRGWRVLLTRPTQAEADLSFAGLGDLLGPVAEEVLDVLPVPQREALEVALLRRAAGDPPPDPRTTGAATLGCLRALAAGARVVVAVDDVQWLDAATARALAFAVRRLGDEPVGVLLARRGAPGGEAPWDLDGARLPGEVHRLAMGPLSAPAVSTLLASRLDWMPPRPTMLRLHEVSGGNPLFALELGRALQAEPDPAPGDQLPVPQRLRDLVAARLRRLDPAHREVLLAAAALRRPTLELLRQAASGAAVAMDAVEAAEAEGLVSVREETVVFAHPLYASVLYTSTSRVARQRLHRGLAAVVDDPEERARHLALAAAAPDETVAAALDDASWRARARGAPEAAAELADLALQLTPPGDKLGGWRRRLAAARQHVFAQRPDAARQLLEPMLASDAPPHLLADALFQLSGIHYVDLGPPTGMQRLEQALAVLGDRESSQRARTLTLLGFWELGGEYPAEVAAEHAGRGMAMAERLGDDDTAAWARLIHLFARLVAGHGLDVSALERTPELDSSVIGVNFRGASLTFSGRHGEARDWLERQRALAAELGGGSNHVVATQQLAELEWRDGNWERAKLLGQEALDAALRGGQVAMAPLVAGYLAVTAACEDRFADAWTIIERWQPVAEPSGYVPGVAYMRWARGFTELCAGNPEAAVEALEAAWSVSEQFGHVEHYVPFRPDLVEALVQARELARAEEVLRILEARGPGANPAYTAVAWLRCRELIAAARGDLDAAIAAGEQAVVRVDALPLPFESARTWLVHGNTLRRARRRRDARHALQRAGEIFHRLGAIHWEQRVAAAADRLGLQPSTSTALTPTEERIARLAADGMTNSAIAGALSISVRTVESNLTRIYRKLGVERRAELVRLLARDATAPVA